MESFRGRGDRNYNQDYRNKNNWDTNGYEFRNKGGYSNFQARDNNYHKKELYSEKLKDPNDPNFSKDNVESKDSFYDIKKRQDERPNYRQY